MLSWKGLAVHVKNYFDLFHFKPLGLLWVNEVWLVTLFICVVLVLPSYAECVYGGAAIHNENDSGDMMGDSTFTPMYPFVNHYQIPSATSQEPQASTSKVALP